MAKNKQVTVAGIIYLCILRDVTGSDETYSSGSSVIKAKTKKKNYSGEKLHSCQSLLLD